MSEKLDKCIRDIQKIQEADKLLEGIEQKVDINSNLEKYLEYIFNHGVISSLEDVFYLTQRLPELHSILANHIRVNERSWGKLGIQPKKEGSNEWYNSIRGVYDRIEDVPGYGSQWNDRCIPDGVSIRRNSGNCRC